MDVPFHGSTGSGFICAQALISRDCPNDHTYREIHEGNGGSVYVIQDGRDTFGASAHIRSALHNAATVAMRLGEGSHVVVTEFVGTSRFDVFHVYGR